MGTSILNCPSNRGFTLIELLVAITIFAILGVLAYGGYNTSVKQSAIAREKMARLKELQTTIRVITQDFEQLAPRPVRDVLGDTQRGALVADARDPQVIVALTRGGWTNPAGVQRSTLQRVAYGLDKEKGILYRDHWTVLDSTLANQPVRRELIKDVVSIKFRYLTFTKQWQDQWPPLNVTNVGGDRSRPLGVELTLELKDFGTLTRLIEVAR